ncbi:prolyl oligopeptidase family serine peptidase [Pendulispora rubella]|uniref:prolyl oligopeptidase n=2 Tax=Pendulispora rubella TaxID=2741070 RepID=A0ABZ2LIH8_9BACT
MSEPPPRKPPAVSSAPAPAPEQRNEPRREPSEEELFGLRLSDPYRWMEKKENAGELKSWLTSEGQRTRQHLELLAGHAKLEERVRELGMSQAFASVVRPVGDLVFYLKTDKGGELRKLVVRSSDGRERVLVDPSTMRTATGGHVSIDHYRPSHDGKWVAYGLAEGGGEITNVYVVETATGRVLPEVLPRIWGEFWVSWRADNSGFYYTQMVPESELHGGDPMQGMRARFHRLGDPVPQDPVVLGPGATAGPPFEPQEFPKVRTFPGSRWSLGFGTGARFEARIFATRAKELSATPGKAAWTTVTEYTDLVRDWAVHGDDLYLLTSKGAPNRRVLRVSLEKPNLADAEVVVAESGDVIEEMAFDAKSLYLHMNHNGRSRLRRLPFGTRKVEDISLPFDGWIDDIVADPLREGSIVHMEGWTREDRYFAFNAKSRAFKDLSLVESSGIDVSEFVADEVEATSSDGTLVPLTILHRKDLPKDGRRNAVLEGYGAYGFSLSPRFKPTHIAWLERGGVYAYAHVRGGGEKGDAWRLAGKGEKKPNSVRDFIACGEYLVREKYTSPSYLAAYGQSAGGILIGRAITERPDLFAAATVSAGFLNTMRFLQGSNGANQKAELGSPDTEAGARALFAMDAFHNIRQGVKYPSAMLATGLNDARSSPWITAKFGAQLRWANAGRPVWLRVEGDEGHGVGSTRRQRFALIADMWSFFLEEMGDPEFRTAGSTR